MSATNVLIAEDNPGLAKVLSFKFKGSGFTPITCPNGQVAWDSFQENDVAAVISDQEMPNLTGVELCRNIRESGSTVPFFLVTGRQLELKATGIEEELSIHQIFGKPFSPAQVVDAVQAALNEAAV